MGAKILARRISRKHEGTIAIIRNEYGRCYGLREIGNRKSWYRWQTQDGKRHRFMKDALAHLDGRELAKLANQIRERAEIQARREAEAERVTMSALAKIANAWGARVEIERQDGRIDRYVRREEALACA
jgi:hypothetical protein